MFTTFILLADRNTHDQKAVGDYEGVIFKDFEHLDDEFQDRDFEVWEIDLFTQALNKGELDPSAYWLSFVYVIYEG